MARLVYTIVCDDVRFEKGKKFSLMGVYGSSILVAAFPYTFPRFALFQHWTDVTKAEEFQIHIRGNCIKPFSLNGQIEKNKGDTSKAKQSANLAVNLNGITIERAGAIIIETVMGGGASEKFEVSVGLAKAGDLD